MTCKDPWSWALHWLWSWRRSVDRVKSAAALFKLVGLYSALWMTEDNAALWLEMTSRMVSVSLNLEFWSVYLIPTTNSTANQHSKITQFGWKCLKCVVRSAQCGAQYNNSDQIHILCKLHKTWPRVKQLCHDHALALAKNCLQHWQFSLFHS